MSDSKKPGTNVGKNGGIYQEVGPRGGAKSNYATVADNKILPPTTQAGNGWKPVDRTPDSRR
ncbi:MAG: YjzC family protein [Methylobacter sp.]|nr:YjzC family protein [Methylobacter sp.]